MHHIIPIMCVTYLSLLPQVHNTKCWMCASLEDASHYLYDVCHIVKSSATNTKY